MAGRLVAPLSPWTVVNARSGSFDGVKMCPGTALSTFERAGALERLPPFFEIKNVVELNEKTGHCRRLQAHALPSQTTTKPSSFRYPTSEACSSRSLRRVYW